jgi:hypothetical protein
MTDDLPDNPLSDLVAQIFERAEQQGKDAHHEDCPKTPAGQIAHTVVKQLYDDLHTAEPAWMQVTQRVEGYQILTTIRMAMPIPDGAEIQIGGDDEPITIRRPKTDND